MTIRKEIYGKVYFVFIYRIDKNGEVDVQVEKQESNKQLELHPTREIRAPISGRHPSLQLCSCPSFWSIGGCCLHLVINYDTNLIKTAKGYTDTTVQEEIIML